MPGAEVQSPLRRWAREFAATSPSPQEAARVLVEGMTLARERRARMEQLMREDPERALAEALDFAEWSALPPEIQALVEKPFSSVADFHFYPVCGVPGAALPPGAPTYLAQLDLGGGQSLNAFVFGRNRNLMSKRSLPVQGIGSSAPLQWRAYW